MPSNYGAAGKYDAQQVGGLAVASSSQYAARTNVVSSQMTIATKAVKADSLILVTPIALGPVGSSTVSFITCSITAGTSFILTTCNSIGMTTVSYAANWAIINQS